MVISNIEEAIVADELAEQMARHAVSNRDKLDALRAALQRRKAVGRELADAEERLAELKAARHDMDTRLLPGMFMEAGVDHIGIPAEGNDPAMDAYLDDFYRASIPMEWPPDKKDAAFEKLRELGLEAIVKRVVEAQFRPGDKGWQKVVKALKKLDVSFSVRDGVHWKTLTSAIQNLCEEGRRPSAGDLDILNAFVGKIVTIKPRSE